MLSFPRKTSRFSRRSPLLSLGLVCLCTIGCRVAAPVHVWLPPPVDVTSNAKVALGTVAGHPEISRRLEQQLLAQRPVARQDVALFTSEQLADSCPIRLVSTDSLTSDITAIESARSLGADVLLQGEILSANLDLRRKVESAAVNYNQQFFAMPPKEKLADEELLIAWRLIDVSSGNTLGSHVGSLNTRQAAKEYPDLEASAEVASDLLIPASAREAWKAFAPAVAKDKVRLASPWLLPGSFRTRLGVRAARKGQWQTAERHWRTVADRFWFNAAAQHNLAIALAAREDFVGAKQQLQQATGIFSHRLPHESLFWLDKRHRNYVASHGLDRPAEGWAFPDPVPLASVQSVEPVDIDQLPWWTAIPFVKPPNWTWQAWLTQPIVL
ncbi:MAG: hypothetical protein KDB22_11390 [Planctomycetales bacterium]|nr:hypothetical protein [Planctomycetales bacterium]